jgi:hypothetical protein
MESMGGHACHRSRWHLRTAHRTPEVGAVNRYGEEVKVGRIVGLCAQQGRMRGRWLVSRRIAWSPLVGDEVITTEQNGAADEGESGIACTALPGTWSGFNNCTARITHELWNEVVGHGAWEMRDENTPEPVIDVTLYREAMRREAMKC